MIPEQVKKRIEDESEKRIANMSLNMKLYPYAYRDGFKEGAQFGYNLDRWIKVEDYIFDGIKIAKFWSKCLHSKGCWEWQGSINKSGYGTIKLGNKTKLTHRIAFQLAYMQSICSNDIIAHACDNPKCVNPLHLFKTDITGNCADKHKKYRCSVNVKLNTKYIGVFYRAENNRYRALMRKNGKYISLGHYPTAILAAKAYDDKMIELYPDLDKSRINLPYGICVVCKEDKANDNKSSKDGYMCDKCSQEAAIINPS